METAAYPAPGANLPSVPALLVLLPGRRAGSRGDRCTRLLRRCLLGTCLLWIYERPVWPGRCARDDKALLILVRRRFRRPIGRDRVIRRRLCRRLLRVLHRLRALVRGVT